MSTLPLLAVDAVGVRREGHTVLDAISLEVNAGSFHVLIGPNGAGKSSLLSAVLGLIPFSGRIAFHWRGNARIGFVPQSFTVDRTLPLTVAEFLAIERQRRPICLGLSRAARQTASALLARVGLPDAGSKRLGALSGGELRRVLVANAIDPPPEILLMDEPAAGLDERGASDLETIVLELRKTHGTTLLLVSHDIAQVRRLADAVTWVEGTIRRTGSAGQVLGNDPMFPFSRPSAMGAQAR